VCSISSGISLAVLDRERFFGGGSIHISSRDVFCSLAVCGRKIHRALYMLIRDFCLYPTDIAVHLF
jgi:hypothetical protein